MTFIPLFSSIRTFLPRAVRSRCQCSRRPVLRVPYKDTTKRWKNKVFWQKQVLSPLSVIESLYTKNAPGELVAALRGHPYIRYALAHTVGIYSISIRFGFSGKAFVC